jgi:hypothetical protein
MRSVFDRHQIAIARKTLQYSDTGALIMGGMTKQEARTLLAKFGIKVKEDDTCPDCPYPEPHSARCDRFAERLHGEVA